MDPSMLMMLLPMLMPLLQQMMGGGAGAGGAAGGGYGGVGAAGAPGGGMAGGMDMSSLMQMIMKMQAGQSQVPYANQSEGAINQGMGLLQNPSKFMGLTTHLAAPLNAQLVKAVQQDAQGGAAEAGLGQSAGAVASATAKALAPYEQSNQQNAQGTAMNMIQQMLASANQFGSPYRNLMNLFGGSAAGGGGGSF
jgi:hypothetical protein